jgi:hypothetical protein
MRSNGRAAFDLWRSGSDVIRTPRFDLSFDLIGFSELANGASTHELRQFFVGRESQSDELPKAQPIDRVVLIRGQHALEAESFLESDDAILHGERHHARGAEQRDESDGHHDGPDGVGRWCSPGPERGHCEVEGEDGERDKVVEWRVAPVCRVALVGHGSGMEVLPSVAGAAMEVEGPVSERDERAGPWLTRWRGAAETHRKFFSSGVSGKGSHRERASGVRPIRRASSQTNAENSR